MNRTDLNWFTTSRGEAPRLVWTHVLNNPPASLAYARESGQLAIADTRGGLFVIDRSGEFRLLAGSSQQLRSLVWSDDGSCGFALAGESRLHWIRSDLSVSATIELPEPALAVACEAFGRYAAVSLANSMTLLFDGPRQPIRQFATTRPLTQLAFLMEQTGIVAIADYGLVCRYGFRGELQWQTSTFSSVGDFSLSSDGDSILVAGFGQGLLRFDSEGNSIGSYQLGGTVCRVASSYSGDRTAAATQELELFWLGADGQTLWSGKLLELPLFLACHPWGTGLILGLPSGRVARLDWTT